MFFFFSLINTETQTWGLALAQLGKWSQNCDLTWKGTQSHPGQVVLQGRMGGIHAHCCPGTSTEVYMAPLPWPGDIPAPQVHCESRGSEDGREPGFSGFSFSGF